MTQPPVIAEYLMTEFNIPYRGRKFQEQAVIKFITERMTMGDGIRVIEIQKA